jgi:hypothetical protein
MEGGLGGEVVFWYPGLPCFRCLLANRYRQHAALAEQSARLNPPSTGSTIFETDFVDSIAGQIVLGLLLRGSTSRFGQLIESLGDRNYLRVKIDPHYRLNGRDHVREELGISADNAHFTGWCVSALRDPDRGDPPCADCTAMGHRPYHDTRAVLSSAPTPYPTEA